MLGIITMCGVGVLKVSVILCGFIFEIFETLEFDFHRTDSFSLYILVIQLRMVMNVYYL